MGKKKRGHSVPQPKPDPEELTEHHIVPKSRGGKRGENICMVIRKEHELYHQMFRNMTPDEILEHLVCNYWNGQWEWIERFITPSEGENSV